MKKRQIHNWLAFNTFQREAAAAPGCPYNFKKGVSKCPLGLKVCNNATYLNFYVLKLTALVSSLQKGLVAGSKCPYGGSVSWNRKW